MPRALEPRYAAALVLGALLAGCATPATRPAPIVAGAAAAAPPAAERQILVLLDSTHEARWRALVEDLARVYDLELLYSWPMLALDQQCLVFALPPERSRADLADRLALDRRVSAVQPVARFRTLATPWNDAYAHLQPALESLGLGAAHRAATGRGVRVALVDTGVDVLHPDLAGQVTLARSFVPRGEESFARDAHGTAVAGVIGAAAGNGIGVVGVSPGVELEALKACWPDPPGTRSAACDSYTLARAIDFALTRRPAILNLSLGGPPDRVLARLLRRAEELGVLVVAAAAADPLVPFPASEPTVLAVTEAVEAAVAGSAGAPVARGAALAAPGDDLLTTGPQGSYDFFSGSSFAAAQASGVAALILELRPDLTPAELRRALVEGARAASGPTGAAPELDACGALAAATGADPCGRAAPPAD